MQGLHQLPAGLDLLAIDGRHRHPDDDGQRGSSKVEHALPKMPIGSRDRGHPLIHRFGRAINRDVDLTDADLMEEVNEGCGDARGIGHEVNHQSLPPRMSENVTDVRPHAWLAAGEGDGEDPKIGDLAQERTNLSGREFMGQGAMRGVVAMDTSQVAAVGQLEGHPFWPAGSAELWTRPPRNTFLRRVAS